MDGRQELTLEQFAEHVRGECITIAIECALGRVRSAGELAAALCLRATDVAFGRDVAASAVRDYDLMSLNRLPRDAPELHSDL